MKLLQDEMQKNGVGKYWDLIKAKDQVDNIVTND